MNLFRFDNPVFNILSRICDMMLLNILWIICSIPIVTIGASTTALCYCMLKITRKSDSGIAAMFFQSFRQNFKQSCMITLIAVLSGLVLYVDYQLCAEMEGILKNIIRIMNCNLWVLWVIMIMYAFPVLAQFDNTVKNTLKNSLMLGIAHIDKTILIFLVNVMPVALLLILPDAFILLLPVFAVFGASLMAWLNSKIMLRVFEHYLQRT